LKGKWHFGATFIDNEGKNVIGCIWKFTLKNQNKIYGYKIRHPIYFTGNGVRDQNHFCTRLRRDVSQLSINASFFKFPLTQTRNNVILNCLKQNVVNCI
jgi:hypothetical protein